MSNHTYKIEERRRQVASLLARSMNQTEIARQLGFDQSTISDDVKALKEMSQRFIYDLAKGDLGYYFKQCIDGINEAKLEAWGIANAYSKSFEGIKYKLAALKIIIQSQESNNHGSEDQGKSENRF